MGGMRSTAASRRILSKERSWGPAWPGAARAIARAVSMFAIRDALLMRIEGWGLNRTRAAGPPVRFRPLYADRDGASPPGYS